MATEPGFSVRACASRLERELAQDLRRSVLCGELHYSRDLVDDGQDDAEGAWLGLAFAGAKPVGTLRLQQQGDWILEHLAVLPQWRRQGVASLLLRSALDQARQRSAASVLACAPDVAAPFFLAHGFEPQRQAPPLTVWQLLIR